MENMSKIHFKGYTSYINAELQVWGRKVKYSSICYKNSIEELSKQVNINQVITEKLELLNRLDKEEVRLFVEKETEEKISNIKIVRIGFDFSEPEDGVCSLDLYLNSGKVFGGFNVHLRLHGDEPRIEMCGLS